MKHVVIIYVFINIQIGQAFDLCRNQPTVMRATIAGKTGFALQQRHTVRLPAPLESSRDAARHRRLDP